MNRQRFKLKDLVVHVTPNGNYVKGEHELLKIKFNKNTITESERHKLILFMMAEKRTKKSYNNKVSPFKNSITTTFTVYYEGKKLSLTVEEYERWKRIFPNHKK